jgi:hypothetical protein
MNIFINAIALLMGIILSGVSGYFSVVGLATIFSGSFLAVMIMAAALESSKIVAATWIYHNWSISPIILRIYMVVSVIILTCITSMGAFGYLSKAHIEQTAGNIDNTLQINVIETQIENEKLRLQNAQNRITTLDSIVQRVDGQDSNYVNRIQTEERGVLNQEINQALVNIQGFNEQLLPLKQEVNLAEAELGPLKYIAELLYGKEAASLHFEESVRAIILIIVFVFDPLALCLIIASNVGFRKKFIIKNNKNTVELDKRTIMHLD